MKNIEGHVYVLISPICEYILIGDTDAAPFKRISEVNACEPYKVLGPWSLYDIRQVADWRRVERSLHSTFRSKLVKSSRGQKELFAMSIHVIKVLWHFTRPLPTHMFHTDRLIRDFAQVERWVKKRSGCFYKPNYARGTIDDLQVEREEQLADVEGSGGATLTTLSGAPSDFRWLGPTCSSTKRPSFLRDR
jgi:hypothetical protein